MHMQYSAVAKKTKEDARHTSVLFTGTIKLPNSAFRLSKTNYYKLIITKFSQLYLFCFTYTLQLATSRIIKSKENHPLQHFLRQLFVPENCQFSSHFSSSYIYVYLSCVKITFPVSVAFKFETAIVQGCYVNQITFLTESLTIKQFTIIML